jgi:glycosyltransferase involved in cell wall biosynthesis
MQITLAHPTPAPFVEQVGRALFEAGMLSQFATTFVARPDAKWLNNLSQLAKIFQIDLSKQLSRRSVTEFPLSLVKDYPWHEIVRILVSLVNKDEIIGDLVFDWGNTAFDRWVAREILPGSQGIYGYEYDCLETFRAAQQLGIARIYEIPSPEHDFMENMIQQELNLYPELHTQFRSYTKTLQKKRTQHRRQEWHLADVAIANSQFTKATYAAAGLDVTKMRVVPLGSPPVCEEGIMGGTSNTEPVRFLWAGNFSINKGGHYLLQAWKSLKVRNEAQIDVFGRQGLPHTLIKNLPESINFHKTVLRSELYEHYRRADVLVFPTLGDGFGMVVTEALAQGLPVITTNQAGAADLVHHGVNGLIVPSGNVESLAEALNWCITHRSELKAMRQAALETAASWQWSDYRLALIENLRDGLTAAGYSL